MNEKDLGKYFIKGNQLYYAIAYIDNPALELKNIITGEKKLVVCGSEVSKEYNKLYAIPVEDKGYDLDKAKEVDNINYHFR